MLTILILGLAFPSFLCWISVSCTQGCLFLSSPHFSKAHPSSFLRKERVGGKFWNFACLKISFYFAISVCLCCCRRSTSLETFSASESIEKFLSIFLVSRNSCSLIIPFYRILCFFHVHGIFYYLKLINDEFKVSWKFSSLCIVPVFPVAFFLFILVSADLSC